MRPSIGRIVHFNDAGLTRAAIITDVHSEECVNLEVFGVTDCNRIQTSVLMGEDVGQWRWPART